MGDKPVTLGAFVKDLRWLLPLSVGTMLVLWALDVKGMRDLGLLECVLVGVGFVFVLGPLVWLRWEHFGGHTKAHWKFLGLSMLWAVVALVIVVVLLGVLGSTNP